jgi:hypothetical protein
VLAHEVGHYKRGHILKGLGLSLLSSFVLFYLLWLVASSPEVALALGFASHSVHAGLTAAAWLYGPLSLALGAGAQALSRRYEYEADAYAVATTGKGRDLADALKRLSTDQLANLNPHPWKVWLEYSHPPVVERVRKILEGEKRQGPSAIGWLMEGCDTRLSPGGKQQIGGKLDFQALLSVWCSTLEFSCKLRRQRRRVFGTPLPYSKFRWRVPSCKTST